MPVLVLIPLLVAAYQVAVIIILWRNAKRTPSLSDVELSDLPLPPVSVIIPARNEEARLGGCLRALSAEGGVPMEILVVDDNSEDRTAEVVRSESTRDPRIRLISAPSPPPGWAGKNHAVHQGAKAARGQYLLFLDADVRVREGTIPRAVTASERNGFALFTVLYDALMPTVWEQAIGPVAGVLAYAATPPYKVNDPNDPTAAAPGPFLLFRKSAYQEIGGHEALRADHNEDMRFAQEVKRRGMKMGFWFAPEWVQVHHYNSLAEIFRGCAKNFYVALYGKLWVAPLGALLLIIFQGLPYAGLAGAAAYSLFSHGAGIPFLIANVLVTLLSLVIRLIGRRYYGDPFTRPYLQPLGALLVAIILIYSAWKARRAGQLLWKGRRIGAPPHVG